jgi:SAM-dependent methyltransferase
VPSKRRDAIIERLGVTPPVTTLVRAALEAAVSGAEARWRSVGDGAARPISALDAGCGRDSQLRSFRSRIGRLVGADIHRPATPLAHLDEFAVVDLCQPGDSFAPGTFDVVLSSFTLEHFAQPEAALANLHAWLTPGGTLVATTVNKRHPFVGAYLGLPGVLRRPLQRLVKSSAADAHPLVGACNDPAAVTAALEGAGFREVRLETVGHLARAWGRTWPTFALGLIGDLLAQGVPSRRSTIVAVARA